MPDLPGPSAAGGAGRDEQLDGLGTGSPDDARRGHTGGYGDAYTSRWERVGYIYGTRPDIRGGWLYVGPGDAERQAEGAGEGDVASGSQQRRDVDQLGLGDGSGIRTLELRHGHLDDIDSAIIRSLECQPGDHESGIVYRPHTNHFPNDGAFYCGHCGSPCNVSEHECRSCGYSFSA